MDYSLRLQIFNTDKKKTLHLQNQLHLYPKT